MASIANPAFRGAPLLGLLLAACGHWCNDCGGPLLFYRYVNSAGYDLVMQPPEQLKRDAVAIRRGDSAAVASGWRDPSEYEAWTSVLRFHSEPESCLVFQGKVQDRALDIRVDNYTLDSAHSSASRRVYRLEIGSAHLRAASPCPAGAPR